MNTQAIQQALIKHGYNLGPAGADGVSGPVTRAAIAAFEKASGLPPDGVPDLVFLKKLFPESAAAPPAFRPWLDLALTKKGLHEGTDNAELRRFLKSDGKTLGDPAKLPWCGDLVETCFALTLPGEPLPANPYLARNWLRFGVPCEPTLGAVAVFWRGARNGTSGHVGFVAGRGDGVLYIVGGNQSNRISVAPLDVKRLLGCRWPKTVPLGAVVMPVMRGGVLSVDEA